MYFRPRRKCIESSHWGVVQRQDSRFWLWLSAFESLHPNQIFHRAYVLMKVDQTRADAWYLAISDFLEAQAGQKDAEAPGSLVTALCRVLADAMEGTDGTSEQKLEAVVRLTAMALGLEEKFLILKDPTGPVN